MLISGLYQRLQMICVHVGTEKSFCMIIPNYTSWQYTYKAHTCIVTIVALIHGTITFWYSLINPQRACTARVQYFVCLSVTTSLAHLVPCMIIPNYTSWQYTYKAHTCIVTIVALIRGTITFWYSLALINPRRACGTRVTVLRLSVC